MTVAARSTKASWQMFVLETHHTLVAEHTPSLLPAVVSPPAGAVGHALKTHLVLVWAIAIWHRRGLRAVT